MADNIDSNVEFSEREALLFHSHGRPGKIEIVASKPMATQRDLSLAYSPGVAIPCMEIFDDPEKGNHRQSITHNVSHDYSYHPANLARLAPNLLEPSRLTLPVRKYLSR